MPELPEVQTLVDDLNKAGLVGRSVSRAHVHWPKSVHGMSTQRFCRQIKGQTILSIGRRAKYIVVSLQDEMSLIVHLRMTGRFLLVRENDKPDNHIHVTLTLDDGRALWFHDTRKFGRFYLTGKPETILGTLGPEPLDRRFKSECLEHIISCRTRQIKPLLLDQRVIAGLGNIYVDEALWMARIHPLQSADTLSADQIRSLHRAIRHVLRQGLKNAGTTLGKGQGNFSSIGERRGRNHNQLKVFRRTGQKCPRCLATVVKMNVGQRGTHICPTCQVVGTANLR